MKENEKEGRESKRARPRALRENAARGQRERKILWKWKNELVEWRKKILAWRRRRLIAWRERGDEGRWGVKRGSKNGCSH